MISKIYSAIPYGYNGSLVEVEGSSNRGLPKFNIVGMADKTINESRERVKSAIISSDFSFPDKRITINLAPADYCFHFFCALHTGSPLYRSDRVYR